ncbi:calcium/calmodulin-regulated receptor-like kinase 1 [Tripterygium wilfordii]|uniref:calcium/calmodulin-regulated receptor-like kinase 1 n=1 Tax=Tripterygium wilfordii TaxID=458696 RepID=UPI0018F85F1E|nr:calcium/calmodulin-regulated receptor-like kinase 1 [Tripterygium wilfordii]
MIEMDDIGLELVIGISVGVVIGVVLGIFGFLCLRKQRRLPDLDRIISSQRVGTVSLGETSETLAVRVLAANSRHQEKDFLSEEFLLGRVHHRNLVNLVGYSIEKGHRMLVYVYMRNGSLDSHLYGSEQLIRVACIVCVPSIVHSDITSSNILLDKLLTSGSPEEMFSPHSQSIRGTLGYVDPEYLSTRTFTRKGDIYSFGVLLFELIAGRNPCQGLKEYVELAAISAEDKFGWEEIADAHLDGKFDAQELNNIAAVAYKCVNRPSRERPSSVIDD